MTLPVALVHAFFGFLLFLRHVECRGVLYIKLNEFYNPLGRTYQGYCCDTGYVDADGVCIDQCDYVMRLIVSGLGRANDHVFLFHQPIKYDSNNVVFKQNDSNLVLTVLFDKWPHNTRVKMNSFFYDYDDNDHTTTLVDWFETDLFPREESITKNNTRHARGSFHPQTATGNRKSDKTQLVFQWSALCDEGSECFQSANLADDLSLNNNFPFFEEFGEKSSVESAYEYKVPRSKRKHAKKSGKIQPKKPGILTHDGNAKRSQSFEKEKPRHRNSDNNRKKNSKAEHDFDAKQISEQTKKRKVRTERRRWHSKRKDGDLKNSQGKEMDTGELNLYNKRKFDKKRMKNHDGNLFENEYKHSNGDRRSERKSPYSYYSHKNRANIKDLSGHDVAVRYRLPVDDFQPDYDEHRSVLSVHEDEKEDLQDTKQEELVKVSTKNGEPMLVPFSGLKIAAKITGDVVHYNGNDIGKNKDDGYNPIPVRVTGKENTSIYQQSFQNANQEDSDLNETKDTNRQTEDEGIIQKQRISDKTNAVNSAASAMRLDPAVDKNAHPSGAKPKRKPHMVNNKQSPFKPGNRFLTNNYYEDEFKNIKTGRKGSVKRFSKRIYVKKVKKTRHSAQLARTKQHQDLDHVIRPKGDEHSRHKESIETQLQMDLTNTNQPESHSRVTFFTLPSSETEKATAAYSYSKSDNNEEHGDNHYQSGSLDRTQNASEKWLDMKQAQENPQNILADTDHEKEKNVFKEQTTALQERLVRNNPVELENSSKETNDISLFQLNEVMMTQSPKVQTDSYESGSSRNEGSNGDSIHEGPTEYTDEMKEKVTIHSTKEPSTETAKIGDVAISSSGKYNSELRKDLNTVTRIADPDGTTSISSKNVLRSKPNSDSSDRNGHSENIFSQKKNISKFKELQPTVSSPELFTRIYDKVESKVRISKVDTPQLSATSHPELMSQTKVFKVFRPKGISQDITTPERLKVQSEDFHVSVSHPWKGFSTQSQTESTKVPLPTRESNRKSSVETPETVKNRQVLPTESLRPMSVGNPAKPVTGNVIQPDIEKSMLSREDTTLSVKYPRIPVTKKNISKFPVNKDSTNIPDIKSPVMLREFPTDATITPFGNSNDTGHPNPIWNRILKDDETLHRRKVKNQSSVKYHRLPKRVQRPSNAELLYHSIEKLKAVKFQTAAPVHWYVTEHPDFKDGQNHAWKPYNIKKALPKLSRQDIVVIREKPIPDGKSQTIDQGMANVKVIPLADGNLETRTTKASHEDEFLDKYYDSLPVFPIPETFISKEVHALLPDENGNELLEDEEAPQTNGDTSKDNSSPDDLDASLEALPASEFGSDRYNSRLNEGRTDTQPKSIPFTPDITVTETTHLTDNDIHEYTKPKQIQFSPDLKVTEIAPLTNKDIREDTKPNIMSEAMSDIHHGDVQELRTQYQTHQIMKVLHEGFTKDRSDGIENLRRLANNEYSLDYVPLDYVSSESPTTTPKTTHSTVKIENQNQMHRSNILDNFANIYNNWVHFPTQDSATIQQPMHSTLKEINNRISISKTRGKLQSSAIDDNSWEYVSPRESTTTRNQMHIMSKLENKNQISHSKAHENLEYYANDDDNWIYFSSKVSTTTQKPGVSTFMEGNQNRIGQSSIQDNPDTHLNDDNWMYVSPGASKTALKPITVTRSNLKEENPNQMYTHPLGHTAMRGESDKYEVKSDSVTWGKYHGLPGKGWSEHETSKTGEAGENLEQTTSRKDLHNVKLDQTQEAQWPTWKSYENNVITSSIWNPSLDIEKQDSQGKYDKPSWNRELKLNGNKERTNKNIKWNSDSQSTPLMNTWNLNTGRTMNYLPENAHLQPQPTASVPNQKQESTMHNSHLETALSPLSDESAADVKLININNGLSTNSDANYISGGSVNNADLSKESRDVPTTSDAHEKYSDNFDQIDPKGKSPYVSVISYLRGLSRGLPLLGNVPSSSVVPLFPSQKYGFQDTSLNFDKTQVPLDNVKSLGQEIKNTDRRLHSSTTRGLNDSNIGLHSSPKRGLHEEQGFKGQTQLTPGTHSQKVEMTSDVQWTDEKQTVPSEKGFEHTTKSHAIFQMPVPFMSSYLSMLDKPLLSNDVDENNDRIISEKKITTEIPNMISSSGSILNDIETFPVTRDVDSGSDVEIPDSKSFPTHINVHTTSKPVPVTNTIPSQDEMDRDFSRGHDFNKDLSHNIEESTLDPYLQIRTSSAKPKRQVTSNWLVGDDWMFLVTDFPNGINDNHLSTQQNEHTTKTSKDEALLKTTVSSDTGHSGRDKDDLSTYSKQQFFENQRSTESQGKFTKSIVDGSIHVPETYANKHILEPPTVLRQQEKGEKSVSSHSPTEATFSPIDDYKTTDQDPSALNRDVSGKVIPMQNWIDVTSNIAFPTLNAFRNELKSTSDTKVDTSTQNVPVSNTFPVTSAKQTLKQVERVNKKGKTDNFEHFKDSQSSYESEVKAIDSSQRNVEPETAIETHSRKGKLFQSQLEKQTLVTTDLSVDVKMRPTIDPLADTSTENIALQPQTSSTVPSKAYGTIPSFNTIPSNRPSSTMFLTPEEISRDETFGYFPFPYMMTAKNHQPVGVTITPNNLNIEDTSVNSEFPLSGPSGKKRPPSNIQAIKEQTLPTPMPSDQVNENIPKSTSQEQHAQLTFTSDFTSTPKTNTTSSDLSTKSDDLSTQSTINSEIEGLQSGVEPKSVMPAFGIFSYLDQLASPEPEETGKMTTHQTQAPAPKVTIDHVKPGVLIVTNQLPTYDKDPSDRNGHTEFPLYHKENRAPPTPHLHVPYMGLRKPSISQSTSKPVYFVPAINIPDEMQALPEEGFILQTLQPHKHTHKATLQPPNPNFIKPVQVKQTVTSKSREIDMDKFRDFVYNIRHGPKVDIPLQGLYKLNVTSIVTNTTTADPAHMLPLPGKRQRVKHSSLTNVETVFTRYWPAVLGITVGTVFLLTGLVTSLLCRQRRLLIQRARWTDSPQHLSEPPDTSEYATSSSASLTSDLARSSANLV